jgi:hypothetical protein
MCKFDLVCDIGPPCRPPCRPPCPGPPGRSSESIRADSDINFAQMIIGEDQCANLISFVTLVPRAAPRAVRRAPGRLEGRPSLSESALEPPPSAAWEVVRVYPS